jgi:hypothetical protein
VRQIISRAFGAASKDLDAKTKDFEVAGRARLVQVTVRTWRTDSSAAPGWELFYSCSLGGLTGHEIRAAGLTETTVQIAPAASCYFRVRRAGGAATAGPIPVSQTPTVTVDIAVP